MRYNNQLCITIKLHVKPPLYLFMNKISGNKLFIQISSNELLFHLIEMKQMYINM